MILFRNDQFINYSFAISELKTIKINTISKFRNIEPFLINQIAGQQNRFVHYHLPE